MDACRGVSGQYGRRDETCPVSTGGGTRRVQSVREGRGGGRWGRTAGSTATRHTATGADCSGSAIGPAIASAFLRREGRGGGSECRVCRPSGALWGQRGGRKVLGRGRACGGRTRRVRLVRGEGRDVSSSYRGRGGGGRGSAERVGRAAQPGRPGFRRGGARGGEPARGTRRVRLVRGEGRGVSD